MFLNRLNKLIFMFIALFAVVLIDSSEVWALECSDSDKNACIKCVYTNGIYDAATGTMIDDGGGEGNLAYVLKSENGIIKSETYFLDENFNINKNEKRKISVNYIDSTKFIVEATNKLDCSSVPTIYINLYGNGLSLDYINKGSGKDFALVKELSTNNNKGIGTPPITCDYPVYTDSKHEYQEGFAHASSNGKDIYVKFDMQQFRADTSEQQALAKVMTMDNYVNNNTCPCYAVECLTHDENDIYTCTFVRNTGNCGAEKPTDRTEDAFECKYTGMINNKSLTIYHGINDYVITYPDGSQDTISKNNVKGNVFTNGCDDVFFSEKYKTLKSIRFDSKYRDSYITQFCRASDDLEQYCWEGNCAITNAVCGTAKTVEIDGNCPSALRLPITFIKRVVFNTLQIFVPIILILMGTIDIARGVMSSDEKNMKDYIGKFIKRVLIAIAFFFITTIVSIVIGMFANTDVGGKDGWKACWQDIN